MRLNGGTDGLKRFDNRVVARTCTLRRFRLFECPTGCRFGFESFLFVELRLRKTRLGCRAFLLGTLKRAARLRNRGIGL